MKLDRLMMKAEPSKADSSILEIYLYSEICASWYDWWDDKVVGDTSAEYVNKAIADHPDCTSINLYINSCGGSVKEGYGIYANLKRFDGDITCYVDGFANSIASIIAMAADKVLMYPGSVMTIHNMMNYCFGNAAEHRKVADDLDKMMEGNRKIYLTRCGDKLTEEQLIEMLDAETVLTAEECVEYGFADEIIEDKDASAAGKAEEAMEYLGRKYQMIAHEYKQARDSLADALGTLGAPNAAPAEEPAPEPEQKDYRKMINDIFGGK